MTLFAGSGQRGKDDGDPLKATFSLPNDIAVSPDGKFMYLNAVAPITGSPQNRHRLVFVELYSKTKLTHSILSNIEQASVFNMNHN